MLERFYKLTIGKKLLVINLMTVSLITLLTIISLCFYMYGTLRDDYQNDSKILSGLLAENVNSALLFGDKIAAQEALAGLRNVDDVIHTELYDKAGNLFAAYTKGDSTFNPPPNFDPRGYRQDIHFGNLTFDNAYPVLGMDPHREQIGTITMQVDLTDAYVHLGYQIVGMLLIGLFGAALFSAMLSKLQKSITWPLRALTETMRKVITGGNFSERVILTSQDEIGELAKVFNHMIDELSRRDFSLNQELKERRNIEARLSQIAHFDPVTQLPNRHSFNNQIDRALVNHKYDLEEFALLYIDLDNFKYVNDSFGHHIGDLMLAKVAERLRNSLRLEDFVARLGGDEFVIIISNFASRSQIVTAANKILATLQVPFSLEGHEAFITASIGIAICPNDGKDSETLQRHADRAMYRAKNQGRNNFQFFKTDLSHTQKNRINIETQLRRSLERKEIFVYYQPIVELTGERIVGFEALVRWIKQDGTVARPDEFIPLAEEIGLINDIGRHVIYTSAVQTAAWVDRYSLSFTSVNFSSRQFKNNRLADDIFNALEKARLKPCNFEMEITESVLMDNSLGSINLLGLLSGQGMGISIDDFGTGYSSLSYITSFPISKIKIDQSFVTKLPNDNNALAVVTAIIGLSKSLNLKVVAEGIETTEQLACLKRLGCQYGQGYLFSKPVPSDEATKLLEMNSTGSALYNTPV